MNRVSQTVGKEKLIKKRKENNGKTFREMKKRPDADNRGWFSCTTVSKYSSHL